MRLIRTERLHIQPMSEADAEAVLDLLTDETVKRTYMLPDFGTREQAMPLFCRLCSLSLDESRFVRGIYLDGEWIGILNDVGIEGGRIELGYALLPQYHGRGFATEALRGVINALLGAGFEEIRAGAFPDNAASIRVMEKSGMRRTGLTERVEYRGITYDCVVYSIGK